MRVVVDDVPNLGGVLKPGVPKLVDVSRQQQPDRKVKMIADDSVGPISDEPQPSDDNAEDDFQEVLYFNFCESGHSIVGQGVLDEGHELLPPLEPTLYARSTTTYIVSPDDDNETPELVFTHKSARYLFNAPTIPKDCELVFQYDNDAIPEAVIQRVNNLLDRTEAIREADKCREAMVKELERWNKHKAWCRRPAVGCTNLLQSRWVLKWKEMKGGRGIKARLVVQGFLDKQAVQNYSGTTTRWGQRLILILPVQFSWSLVSLDVSEAFLRGITFKELHEADPTQPLRTVQLKVPPGSGELIRSLTGMQDFDESKEVLEILKPGFGLKDTPRLWNIALKRVLSEIGVQPISTDPQLYVKHANGALVLALSVHVDDLKLTGQPHELKRAKEVLERHFDELKSEVDRFEHWIACDMTLSQVASAL